MAERGASPVDRAAPAAAHRAAKAGVALSVVLALPVLFWRFPPAWLLVLPCLSPLIALALVRWSGDAITLSGVAEPGRPSVFVMAVSPAIVGYRAAQDLNPATLPPVIAMTAAGGLALVLLYWLVDRRVVEDLGLLAFLVFCACAGAGGLAMEVNVRADRAPPEHFSAVVTDRWAPFKQGGRRLRLTAWGPMRGGETVKVPKAVYWNVEAGQTVCPNLYPGALGVPWYEVTVCRP